MISKIRKEVEKLFPKKTQEKRKIYCTKNWIFPNHIDPMIDISKDLCEKYNGDNEVCEIACLLHDTGLVYKRKSKNPKGHEKNSLEFAEKILKKYNVPKEKEDEILNCIKATEIEHTPKTTNEKIVRTADILSQFNTIHFLAKAHFYSDWGMYLKFLEKKINKGFNKICFKEEREKIKPIRKYIKSVLLEYKKYN